MSVKLIVVDDEESIRETIKDYFEDSGWEVKVFSSGEDALEYLNNDSPEFVIVDGRLPGMTGTEFIRRSIQVRKGIKYLIYTGFLDFTIDDDLREAGIDEKNILVKPAMGFSILRSALENLNNN